MTALAQPTLADTAPARAPSTFSPRVVLALVLVGIVSFAGLAVLSAYAPDIRADSEGGANALSGSAVGYKGTQVMLQARGVPVVVNRTRPTREVAERSLLVLTPPYGTNGKELASFPPTAATLVVLPKWQTIPDPRRKGYVKKAGLDPMNVVAGNLLKPFADSAKLANRKGVSKPVLRGAGGLFAEATYLPLAQIDSLQTISGPGWIPVLVDDQGKAVLAKSKKTPYLYVLADPDLLNTQGLAKLDNARAGMAVLDGLRGGRGVIFDVTLNGYKRARDLWRMMLEPPWLAATLCAVAAALLMGLHALARFGPAHGKGRAFALGKRALVDNSAGLVRMAHKEHELAPAYVALTKALIAQAAGGQHAAGGDHDRWLAGLARARETESPDALALEAEQVRSGDAVLGLARKLYRWRLEMTRERR